MIELTKDGEVWVLTMGSEENPENRLSPAFMESMSEGLTALEFAEGPRALVLTGSGKFFSNGLDLDHLNANPNELIPYLFRVHALFGRLLALPCPTVAALNGHTFAAGAMISICFDHRIMREDRGYWCLPEVDLGMPFTEGMNALIPATIPSRTAHEAMLTGRRYSGAEALAGGIVNELAADADVLPKAIEKAASLASKAGPGIAGIRTHLYAPVLAALSGHGHDGDAPAH